MLGCTWKSLGAYFSSPGVFTEVIHLYLATDLTPDGLPRRKPMKFSRSNGGRSRRPWRKRRSGELTDGKTIIGILRAASRRKIA